MGASIALKEDPQNAWVEAQIGFGGPLLGSVGALLCWLLFQVTGVPLFSALAYTGYFLNLFNLIPIGFLDGGRVVSSISLWLWVIGVVIAGIRMYLSPNLLLFFIILASMPHMWRCFRNRKTPYYQVAFGCRVLMSVCYFGLIVLLVAGMAMSYIKL